MSGPVEYDEYEYFRSYDLMAQQHDQRSDEKLMDIIYDWLPAMRRPANRAWASGRIISCLDELCARATRRQQ